MGHPSALHTGGQQRADSPGQEPVQLLLAGHRHLPQRFGGGEYQREELLLAHAKAVGGKPDAPGVDPGLFPGSGEQCREKSPRLRRRKDQRHPADAPGLEQHPLLLEEAAQSLPAYIGTAGPEGGLPGTGRGVLHTAGPGGRQRFSGGQPPVQMVGPEPVGQHRLRRQRYSARHRSVW